MITGSVYWALQPVPGASVQLKQEGGFHTRPVFIETTTDANGNFVITDAPVGKYMIYAVAPNGSDYWEWTGRSATTASNTITKTGTLYLSKKLTLLEPINNGIIRTELPMFKWEAFPNAVNYHIDVFDNTSGDAIFRLDTTGTALVSPVALTANEYQWSVWAYDANGLSLAYYSPFYFTVQP